MNILLVEDDENDADLLRSLLKRRPRFDFELNRAETLTAALEQLRENPPDIVLLDLNLPDSAGVKSVERIQSANSEVPIVVLSGQDDEDFAIEILNYGVQDYLVKWEGNAQTIMRAIRYAVERKKTELRLNYLAHCDRLTGLSNRQHFSEQLDKTIARARRSNRRVALYYVDLDNFKIVNDTLGHDAGDQVLVSAAKRIQACVRSGDIIARLGGDEFAILVDEIGDLLDAEAIGNNILEALTDPHTVDGRSISVTCSIGVSLYPSDTSNVATLLKNADIAMYQAKQNGRNGLRFFTERMQSKILDFHRIESEIYTAIADEQFHLVFQPKINLHDDSLCGLEALIRWQHPSRGEIPPSEFIPVAESSGHIVPLGYWVLEHACRHIQAWRSLGLTVPRISINVSALQFQQPDFHKRVDEVIQQTATPPELVELELTEAVLIEDTDGVQRCLRQLRDIGVRLSIDDFGTGHSCLSYLRRFPIDVLKIDKSFVADIGQNSDGEAICAAIISMATQLNLETVAEGIESDEQLRFLIESGCNVGQGFYFSRPVRADRLETLFPSDMSTVSNFGDTTRIQLLQGVGKA